MSTSINSKLSLIPSVSAVADTLTGVIKLLSGTDDVLRENGIGQDSAENTYGKVGETRVSFGEILYHPDQITESFTGVGASVAYAWPDGATTGSQISYNAAPASKFEVQFIGGKEIPMPASQIRGFGFWAYNPGSVTKNLTLTIRDTAYAKLIEFYVAVPPGGPNFLTVSSDQNITTGGNGIAKYAIFLQTNVANTWPDWVAGDSVVVGALHYNPSTKPAFMLATDDGYAENIVPIAGSANFPSAGRSYVEIAAAYGLRGTAYIIGNQIGQAGRLTGAQIKAMQDKWGWSIGSHSNTHPTDGSSNGLMLLGPVGVGVSYAGAASDDSAILADINAGIAALSAIGVSNPGRHFALPQGGCDQYVASACKKAGIKSVRGIRENVYTVSVGRQSGGGLGMNVKLINDGTITHPIALQLDVAVSEKSISAVTAASDLITFGAAHGMTTGDPIALFAAGSPNRLPSPLHPGDTYWAIVVDATNIKVATTYENAIASTAIDLLDTGAGALTAINLAWIKTAIDSAIAKNCHVSSYMHTLTYQTAARVNFVCQYVRSKVNGGVMNCWSADDWWAAIGKFI